MTLEELLNKLIEKGWKPRWFEKVYNFWIKNWYTVLNTKKANYISFATSCVFREDYWEEQKMDYVSYTYRELVSKESWLWQFVCENGMVRNTYLAYCKHLDKYADDEQWYYTRDYQYRLIESALKDESELEEFLLSNIVIKDE